ncbi:MAG TPA: S41 family peptidase [Aggregatilineaceae bacterium]|nr:S41 family peptidase [Aggregatilineaceae bacterium]
MKRLVHHSWRLVLTSLVLFGVLGLGTVSGVLLDRQVLAVYADPGAAPTAAPPDLPLVQEAYDMIQRVYVDRTALKAQEMEYGAIGGMVDALGDTGHSRFLSPAMVKQESELTQGQFEGIGVEVQMKNGAVVVVAPIDGTPAQRAGLRPGDIIAKVDGRDVTSLPLDQVVTLILGPTGTSVTLTIMNPDDGQTRDVTLVRARITMQNVAWHPLPGTTIAHVRIAAFSQGVSKDLQKALSEVRAQGMTGVILDLRNDPGGLLDESIGTASQFLKSGNVLLEKDAQGNTTPVSVQSEGAVTDLPMVVLINGGTASAAEILAGALQDAHRGTLVGETTFGTGTVLSQFHLSDGSALLLATEEWLTPAGRVIWHHGISPDVAVTLPKDTIPLLPEGESELTAAQLQTSGDAQILRAVDLLK